MDKALVVLVIAVPWLALFALLVLGMQQAWRWIFRTTVESTEDEFRAQAETETDDDDAVYGESGVA